LRGCWVTALPA